MNIYNKQKDETIEGYINKINLYIRDDSRRCRILLAEVLRMLDKIIKNK